MIHHPAFRVLSLSHTSEEMKNTFPTELVEGQVGTGEELTAFLKPSSDFPFHSFWGAFIGRFGACRSFLTRLRLPTAAPFQGEARSLVLPPPELRDAAVG